MIAFAFCGSYCTHRYALRELEHLVKGGAEVVPVFSENVWNTDTRFGTAAALKSAVSALCGREIVHTIASAEPFGPREPPELLIICPCTGNTLSKIASGITDTSVTMAAKAQLRQGRPLLIALSTNDGLGANLANLGLLLNRKNVFFLPMFQDDPVGKPSSLSADFSRMEEAVAAAMNGKQLRPLFCG